MSKYVCSLKSERGAKCDYEIIDGIYLGKGLTDCPILGGGDDRRGGEEGGESSLYPARPDVSADISKHVWPTLHAD